MSALPFDSLEVVAPTGGTTRARSERLRVVSTPRPCLIGPSFPELLEIWERALTAADVTTIGIASVVIMLACGLLFKELSLLCFDDAYAAALSLGASPA